MKNVMVTGVSSGIGQGLTKELVGRGYRVFGSVRKAADAEKLTTDLGERFAPLVFDVTDKEAILRAAREVGKTLGDEGLAGLVNNAGGNIPGPLMHQPLEEVRTHFEVNVLGLISTTQAFLPLLGAKSPRTHPPGRIVNVSSTVGRYATPFLGAFSGAEHAVEGVSDSFRRELLPYGIDVIVVRPGPVKTGTLAKEDPRLKAYDHTDYKESFANAQRHTANLRANQGYSTEEFCRRMVDVFEKKRPKTRYAIVPHRMTNWTIPTLMPDRLLDRVLDRTFGITASK